MAAKVQRKAPQAQSPNVKIDADLAYELGIYAKTQRTTMKAVVGLAVRQYLDRKRAA